MFASLKLTAGQLYEAYREYPRIRRELLRMPGGPPIFVTGAYRSGTTWFAKMLAIPGVWYLHEPFNPNKGLWKENFSYLSNQNDIAYAGRILESLLKGRLRKGPKAPILHQPRADHWLMPARILLPKVNRILIKDPIACLMSESLTNKFQLQTIVLFRHPAGFVSSLKALEWDTSFELQGFLRCRSLMNDWLFPYRSLIERMCGEDGISAAATLHACLNTVLWGFTIRNKCMAPVFYEKLCDNPIEKFRMIFNTVGLPYSEKVKKQHLQLCVADNQDRDNYYPFDVCRNSADMAYRWRRLLTVNEVDKIHNIWTKFQLPFYQSDEEWRM